MCLQRIMHTLYLNVVHNNLGLRVPWISFLYMPYWPGHRSGKWGIVPLWYPQESSPVEKVQTQARSMHLGIVLLLSVRDSERSRYSYYKHKSTHFKNPLYNCKYWTQTLEGRGGRSVSRHSIFGWILRYRGLWWEYAKYLQRSKIKHNASIENHLINEQTPSLLTDAVKTTLAKQDHATLSLCTSLDHCLLLQVVWFLVKYLILTGRHKDIESQNHSAW